MTLLTTLPTIITARKQSCGKVMFYRCLSVCTSLTKINRILNQQCFFLLCSAVSGANRGEHLSGVKARFKAVWEYIVFAYRIK